MKAKWFGGLIALMLIMSLVNGLSYAADETESPR
ncbi:hypothetical protein ES708_25215 [subsurface metagenome]